jgi:D-arabinose 5-phosphate isomerase GutQ
VINELMLRDIRSQSEAVARCLTSCREQLARADLAQPRQIIITGSGDSYIAAVAIRRLFDRHLGSCTVALSSLDASRYVAAGPEDLVVISSVSGEVARSLEVARRRATEGATLIAVTAAPDSSLARACDLTLTIPEPIDRSIPHSRDYSATLLGLACILERLAADPLPELDRLPELIRTIVDASLERAEAIGPTEARSWFLGAGPDRATAMFGALKYWEAAGMEAWWDDLEEFGHGSQLMARPGDRAVVIAAGAGSQRAREMVDGLRSMGMDVITVGGSDLETEGVQHMPTTDELGPDWHPFVSCLPLQALALTDAEARGLEVSIPLFGQPHGPAYDEVHRRWTRESLVLVDEDAPVRPADRPPHRAREGAPAMPSSPHAFYLPEDPGYTIVASALDAIRFLRHVSDLDPEGRLMCRSIDATPDGNLARYRDRFMEGVGYCADSVFGAHMLIRFGRATERPEFEAMGFSYLDHVLATGFFDDPQVPMRLYRDTETGAFLHNLEGDERYVELGHVARVATHLLALSELDPDPERADACRSIALRTAAWVATTERCANGWFPRRCTPDGRVFPYAANAFGPTDLAVLSRIDPIADRSGTGTFALELLVAVTAAGSDGLGDAMRSGVEAFMGAGGHFGSTNTDTEDPAENLSYAIAFQTLIEAGRLLRDDDVTAFAYDACLAPLTRFELDRDLNGVATKGLLYMEDGWNAACTWEMAEAAQAYLVAFEDRGALEHLYKALTIMRGMAKHHHGPFGFLTEAVDWDGHSTSLRHFPGERYGDIITTHPFLNNLHVLHPTVTFLERNTLRLQEEGGEALYDPEGNRLCAVPLSPEPWMAVTDAPLPATDDAPATRSAEAAREVLRLEAEAVIAMAARIDASFDDTVAAIRDAGGRVIVTGLGKSGHVGKKIAATLASTGTPAHFVHATEGHHGDLGTVTSDDAVLAISNSGETDEVVALALIAKERGAVVIGMTGIAGSALARAADVVLDVAVEREADPHGLAPTSSTTAMLAMGDALAIALMTERGFGRDDFLSNHPGGAIGAGRNGP